MANENTPPNAATAAANDSPKHTVPAALYVRLEALDRDQHRQLKLKATNYSFASTHLSAALVCGEFTEAALVYPIVFVQGDNGKVRPMAAFGIRNGENLFVNAQGQWDAPYTPALVRQYPFTAVNDSEGKLVAAIDAGSDWVNTSDGQPLFNDKGEPAEILQNALQFMENLHGEYQMTEQFCAMLQEHKLLEGMDVSAPVPGGQPDERLSVGGFMAVNEEKLRAVPDATIVEWHKNGALPLIYAHLFSLRNFNKLMATAFNRSA
jgi:SapC